MTSLRCPGDASRWCAVEGNAGNLLCRVVGWARIYVAAPFMGHSRVSQGHGLFPSFLPKVRVLAEMNVLKLKLWISPRLRCQLALTRAPTPMSAFHLLRSIPETDLSVRYFRLFYNRHGQSWNPNQKNWSRWFLYQSGGRVRDTESLGQILLF